MADNDMNPELPTANDSGRVIEIDATGWKTILDFYDAVYPAIEAPKDASRSLDALLEYMIWYDMGALRPPYEIVISNLGGTPPDVVKHVEFFRKCLGEARYEYWRQNEKLINVHLEIMS